ncbi:hypothetical protein K7X08_020933 [Anisodus acutangulus]|uniref:Uncharacterized protein n=1 Tax=Anisodus acutangulus TaxID=402998 RepID=A0A9Q1MU55_9SOLA|nr:hypothetical protein K7X08_020933 [Anisodus acutangulus]
MLKRDKNVLMQELVKLRQHQQTTDNQMQTMVQNLQIMEQRQPQMMLFLAKAVNSPGFLAQFVQQQNDNNKRMMEDNKKRMIRQYIPSDDHSSSPADGHIVKYQPIMNEAAKAMLRQIMGLDSSPRLENFSNSPESLLIGDGSLQCNGLDGGSNNWNLGVTLQEVSPASVQPFSSATSAVVGQNIIMPEPSQLQEIMPENNKDINGSETGNGSFMDPMLGVNGKFPLELDTFSPDLQIEWKSALMDDDIGELLSVGGPFWEKFLQSPFPTETDEMDSVEIKDIKTTETKPLENGWDKVPNMEHLTEQMELLTSNSKKSMIGHQRKCT